ncbi:hypothetical protein, partial [Klebsiella pneumoniae]|uniref:hypothetical protein n=1 Tax=Klebsiella pneumoniae TaxID=573 RepID=UPI001F5DF850
VLDELPLPSNVETKHFGAIAGIDRWKDAAGLICIGQQQPGPQETEPVAGAITGRVPEAIPPKEHDIIAYPQVPAGIRFSGGGVASVQRFYHPDPTVEAVRYQNTEAGLLQAIGR